MTACATRLFALIIISARIDSNHCKNVIYAVNVGGEEHVDAHGVYFQRDPVKIPDPDLDLHKRGSHLFIRGATTEDGYLYGTQRRGRNFTYEIPVFAEDSGDYVFAMKFVEIDERYRFMKQSSGKRKFQVFLNENLQVVKDLNVCQVVSFETALDVKIAFVMERGLIIYNDQYALVDEKILINFIGGGDDGNGIIADAMISAFYLVKLNPYEFFQRKPLAIVYALNCFGNMHLDTNGIFYNGDENRAFSFFQSGEMEIPDIIKGVPLDDMVLHAGFRRGNLFGYDIPVREDGNHVLVLKFHENHMEEFNVFDLMLNKVLVASRVSIFDEVGSKTLLEKRIEFRIYNGTLVYGNETSTIHNSSIRLEISASHSKLAGELDAFYVFKGNLSELPKQYVHDANKLKLPTTLSIVKAINVGGPRHVNVYGITFQKDPLSNDDGSIHKYAFADNARTNVPNQDRILYETERTSKACFGYNVPVQRSAHYVLVLKFCENRFNSTKRRRFNVVLNKDFTVLRDLDVFEMVGRSAAHQVHVPFYVRKKRAFCMDRNFTLAEQALRFDVCGGSAGRPMLNAFYVVRENVRNLLVAKTRSFYSAAKVPWAINAGGPPVVDINGVKFEQDPLIRYGTENSKSTTVHYDILDRERSRDLSEEDEYVYTTERHGIFSYDVKFDEPGDYVLVLCLLENDKPKPFRFYINDGIHVDVTNDDLQLHMKRDKLVALTVHSDRTLECNGQRTRLANSWSFNVKFNFTTVDHILTKIAPSFLNGMYLIRKNINDFQFDSETSLSLNPVLYAINFGGQKFTDSNGICYRSDFKLPKAEIAYKPKYYSDKNARYSYFKDFFFVEASLHWTYFHRMRNVSSEDRLLYMTGRMFENVSATLYHEETPVEEVYGRYKWYSIYHDAFKLEREGSYVIVFKFVNAVNGAKTPLKIFLNNYHILLNEADIYDSVEAFVAFDKTVTFVYESNRINVKGKLSNVVNESVALECFTRPNLGIVLSAMYIMRSTLENVPKSRRFEMMHSAELYDFIVLAINIGGKEFIDSLSVRYEQDPYYERTDNGERIYFEQFKPKTRDYTIYKTARCTSKDNTSFYYDFAIAEKSRYVLLLKFIELVFKESNQRQFDVLINNITVSQNLDIYKKAGRRAHYNLYVPFRTDKGVLYFGKLNSALTRNNNIKLVIRKGAQGQAMLSALILFKDRTMLEVRKVMKDEFNEAIGSLRKNGSVSLKRLKFATILFVIALFFCA